MLRKDNMGTFSILDNTLWHKYLIPNPYPTQNIFPIPNPYTRLNFEKHFPSNPDYLVNITTTNINTSTTITRKHQFSQCIGSHFLFVFDLLFCERGKTWGKTVIQICRMRQLAEAEKAEAKKRNQNQNRRHSVMTRTFSRLGKPPKK